MKLPSRFVLFLMSFLVFGAESRAETVVDFQDLNQFDQTMPAPFGFQILGAGDAFNGYASEAPTGEFSSQGVNFPTVEFGPGFSYSRFIDTTSPGFVNPFAALPGGGSDGAGGVAAGETYGMVFTGSSTLSDGTPNNGASLTFDASADLTSIDIANSTYTALYFRDGLDSFAPEPDSNHQFSPGDFLSLTITGLDSEGGQTGSQTVDLARFEGGVFDESDYIEGWDTIDLSGFDGTSSLTFSLASNDFDPVFGLNIPAYVAIDNLQYITAVPEPGIAGLSLLSLGVISLRRRRR